MDAPSTHFVDGAWQDRRTPLNRERVFALAALTIFAALLLWAYATRPERPATAGQTVEAVSLTSNRVSAPPCADVFGRQGAGAVGTCRTRTATLTAVAAGDALTLPGVTLRSLDTKLLLATTASGKRRQRARLSVGVALRNTTGRPLRLALGSFVMSAGGASVAADAADRKSDRLRLDEPIPAGAVRSGVLRFETAGATTAALAESRRADLGLRVLPERVGVVRLRSEVVRPAS